MAKKKTNKQPWSSSLESREAMYKGINPSSGFDPLSIATQTIGYLGGFRTGHGMPEDEARWASYLGLPYDKTYAPDTKIRFEGDENYPDRQYQGLSKRAKDEVRKKILPQAKRIKDKYNKEWIQVLDTKPNSEYNYDVIYHDRQNYLGDLGKFGIREVGESGIYEVGDKYDFPALIPIPSRNEGTELMVRDTIWSDRANPKLYNKEIIKRKNKHDIGGLLSKLGNWNQSATEGLFKDKDSTAGGLTKFGQFAKGFGINSGNIGSIANIGATAIGGALAGGRSTAVGNAMQKVGSLASNIPGIGGLIGAGVNLLGGITNGAFGSKLNAENIAAVEGDIKQALNFNSNAGDYDALASNYAELQGVRGFNQDFIGKDGWAGGSKAKDKFSDLKTQAEEAEAHQLLSLTNNATNIANNNQQLMEANYTAYGGPINMKYTGVMSPFGNQFDGGGPLQSIIDLVNSKDVNFVKRLKDPNRKHIKDWESDNIATHKLGVATDDLGNNYIYPEVQEINGKLVDFTRPPYHPFAGQLSAEERGDTVRVNNIEDGLLFTENYKKFYPKGKTFVDGGSKNSIPTQEEYIAQQIANKRTSALDKSRNRIYPRVPMSGTRMTEEEWLADLNNREDDIRNAMQSGYLTPFLRNKLNSDLRAVTTERNMGYDAYRGTGEPLGSSCTATAFDNYGMDIISSELFRQNHEKYGFKNISNFDVQPSDIVIDVENGKGSHTMMLNSGTVADNNLRFNASNGGFEPQHIRKNAKYPFKGSMESYTFVGTPADSTQWINEYKEMYNKKADGGNLFTNGVTTIGNGGTHEENPFEGVQLGVDKQGIPNLVEEGEVIFDDYVFSNRLRVPKAVRQKYKLRGTTFADAAKQLQKESEERPNDPISKNGLEASMKMLMNEQEMIRAKKESNKYAKGGKLGRLYEGEGPDSQWLYKPVTPGYTPSKDDILAEMETIYPSLTKKPELTQSARTMLGKDLLSYVDNKRRVEPMKDNWLRKLPIWMSGVAVANDLLGGNEPDYSNANIFDRAIEGTNRQIGYRPIGNYLKYIPFDTDYYINKLNANTAAGRRALMNTSGGNRAAAVAGILATDYNHGNQLGDLARKAEEYNLDQRQKVEQFNRGTSITNAEMAMKADLANAEQAMQRARMYGSLAEYRDKILAANRAEKSANLTNFIQGLGDLGREIADRDMLRWLTEKGVLKSANGGKINRRKKRGGFTI